MSWWTSGDVRDQRAIKEFWCYIDSWSSEKIWIFVELNFVEQVKSVSSIPVRTTSNLRRNFNTPGGFVMVLHLHIDVLVADAICRLIWHCVFRRSFDWPCFQCGGLPSSVSIIGFIAPQVWGQFSQPNVFSSTESYLASDCSQRTALPCLLRRSRRVGLPPASTCNQGHCSSRP